MLILKACTLHNYSNRFCCEKTQKYQIKTKGLGSVSPWICEVLTGFQVIYVFFSISALYTCHSVLQGGGWALPEQEADLCQAAGGSSFAALLQDHSSWACSSVPGCPEPWQAWDMGDAALEYLKQEEMQVTSSQSSAPHSGLMWHALCHGGGDLWKCQCYWQWGHFSAPRNNARVSGIDWDFCASILCAVIHVKEIETEMRVNLR